ncbi:MAG: fumarate hydratase [Candidatus Caldatribacteriaceae bacterium]
MKVISAEAITKAVDQALWEINLFGSEGLREKMFWAWEKEDSALGREMLSQILENYAVAEEKKLPLCQDTGMVMAEVIVGDRVQIEGGSLREALDEGIRRAYQRGYFRKSIISDPFFGENTQDNTPGVYFFDLVRGDSLHIELLVKGGGCDNVTTLQIMEPGSSIEEVETMVLRVLEQKAPQACPPLIVGVGIGGSALYALFLAHRALARPLGSQHPDQRYREIEEKWLQDVNGLGIGPQGVGGKVTCLEVRIETYSCHIASFPVGIACSCHVFRKKSLWW